MPYCPNCGKETDKTANFCRGCGFRLTEEHDNQDITPMSQYGQAEIRHRSQQQAIVKPSLKWGAILIGVLVGLIVQISISFIVGHLAVDTSDALFIIIAFAIGVIAYISGGTIAGNIAGYRGATHGLLAGLFTYIISVIIIAILLY